MVFHKNHLIVLLLVSAVFGLAVVACPVAQAATITAINNDGTGEGFNDPTPAAPVGGNTGTTLGAQRLIAFRHAADLWGGLIVSPVTIRVSANFDPLTCDATLAILGSAGPTNVFRDFTGSPAADTWYPVALANALSGTDLNPGGDDISATFNGSIGTTCAFPRVWYYGLDANPPGNTIDFVSVARHELGHGLGFLTFVNLASGAKLQGRNDTFMRNLEDHGASPADYPSMTDAQRVLASRDTGNLHWVGANVRAASGVLTAGAVGDHVPMFAPNTQQSGSSLSHWDTTLTPNQVMEPSYTGPLHNPGLEPALFGDIGWTVVEVSPTIQLSLNKTVFSNGDDLILSAVGTAVGGANTIDGTLSLQFTGPSGLNRIVIGTATNLQLPVPSFSGTVTEYTVAGMSPGTYALVVTLMRPGDPTAILAEALVPFTIP
jgi:hypothetical protein